jgi:hypothetical protein
LAETRFTVEDGRCGNCHCLLVEHQSNGAQYAVDKRVISESHTIILAQWLSSRYSQEWATKEELKDAFNVTKTGAFDGRLSELKSIGTAYGQPLIHSTKNVKSSPHNTTSAPRYRLNMGRVCQVMNNKGVLA